jgi:acyl-CoA synthetase (AMP-forming)/AMP-acid ligase II
VSSTATVARADLLGWLARPSAHSGLHVAAPDGGWTFVPYRDLAPMAWRAARALRALGLPDGAVVGIVAHGGPAFVAALFGTLAAGYTAAPLPPPNRFQHEPAHSRQLGSALRVAEPAALLVEAGALERIRPLAPPGCPVVDIDTFLAGAAADPVARDGAGGLVQFTSGSSGPARAVRITPGQLSANVYAIGGWLRMAGADATATWLPPYHDMGLVGCLVTPVVYQSDAWVMRPEEFVHRPLRYLECFGRYGATLTAMPAFGLDYLVRRVPASRLAGLDFSRWRAVIVGAERIDPATLTAFAGLLAPYGFDARALAPAYGLAEATLAVTGKPAGEHWRGIRVDPAALRPGARVRTGRSPAGQRWGCSAPPKPGSACAPPGTELVSCGAPLAGTDVSIVDDGGRVRPDGVVGEIAVRGPGVAGGYLGADGAAVTRLAGGSVRTGDAGFLLDGELYVLGRLGDGVKVRGRMLFAEELEAALRAAGVPPRRVAVLLGEVAGEASVVALFERARPEWLARAGLLLGRLTAGAPVLLLDAPAGTIARTSSGKPRRRQLWRDFQDGRLPSPTPMMTVPMTGGIS